MSEDLKKMKVTIEGDTKSLKKELGSARQETRRSSAVIRKEIEKIKQSMSGKLPKVPQNISTRCDHQRCTGNCRNRRH